jgi:hypothetical protein
MAWRHDLLPLLASLGGRKCAEAEDGTHPRLPQTFIQECSELAGKHFDTNESLFAKRPL